MKQKLCILLILSLGTIAFAQSPSSVAPEARNDTTTTAAPDTSTTAAPSTTTPIAPETSTTAAPTTTPSTTAAPTTTAPTSTAPPTTTEPTTTAPPTTTTPTTTTKPSTVPPTPPPTPKPTPTLPPVAPTPPVFPKNVGNWSLVQGGESPCILLTGAFQLHVNRNNASDLIVDVPNQHDNVDVSGRCSHPKQTLVLKWWSKVDARDNTTERNNTLRMEFLIQPDNNSSYALSLVRYQYDVETPIEVHGPFFQTNLNHSFLCKSNQKLENDKNPSYVLTQDLQFEAFRPTSAQVQGEPKFNAADECKADNRKSTGVVLGIAVGVGLLIVVVISLGIYLYKRCRRGGYQPLDTYS